MFTKRIDDLNFSISEYISERAYLGEWPDQGILFPEFNIVISGVTFDCVLTSFVFLLFEIYFLARLVFFRVAESPIT